MLEDRARPAADERPTPGPATEVWETDWLGLPVAFYDTTTGRATHRVQDLLEGGDRDWSPEGIRDYLDFGVSMFGFTPFRGIRFLLPCQRLVRSQDSWTIEDRPDPLDSIEDFRMTEEELWERLQARVRAAVSGARTVCLPLSGGLDSRVLAALLRGHERAQAFTYGVSPRQDDSYEVAHAREVARRLQLPWQQVPLRRFLTLIPEWEDQFGPVVHDHGMYHIEFYEEIRRRLGGSGSCCVVSGLFGDYFGGKHDTRPMVRSPRALSRLFVDVGLSASSTDLLNSPSTHDHAEEYYERYADQLRDPTTYPAHSTRLKIMLLRYTVEVPRALGFDVAAPFLDPDIAIPMLLLSDARRDGRRAYRDLLARNGLDLESDGFRRGSFAVGLNRSVWRASHTNLEPLDIAQLGEIASPRVLERINDRVVHRRLRRRAPHWLWTVPKVRGVVRRVVRDPWTRDFHAYLTWHPLQSVGTGISRPATDREPASAPLR
jgi:asparagine synthetase B (glutamine-hydrolysing)